MKKFDLKTFDLGQSVSTLANIGVLAGLILVAVQISQSTDIARAQLANDYYLADMQLELSMMGDAPVDSWTKAVYSPDDLTRRDAAILDRYFNFGVVQVRRLQQMQQLGLADDEVLAEQIDYLKWHLGNEVGRKWWVQYKAEAPDDAMVKTIDKALASNDYGQNRKFLDALLPTKTNH